ncbi:MAG: thioredoxin family protein [Arcobacter sp.]|nr:thioredoxin family protein [Arcobacter sp.]
MTKYDASKTDNVTIYKVDIDKEPALAKRFNIIAVPVLVYTQNGKTVKKESGVKSVEDIKENVVKYFK